MTERERWRAIAAAIASVSVFGLSISESAPLLSLLLAAHGTGPTLIGLNAAAGYLGVILGPLLAPAAVRRLGIRNVLLAFFACDIVVFLLLGAFSGFDAWLALRFLLGVIGSGIFTVTEAWINLLAGTSARGRTIGLYAAALSVGLGSGPLLLFFTGIHGWPPFIANALVTGIATLPLLGVRNVGQERGGAHGAGLLHIVVAAPFILFAVGAFGLYEAASLTLLPIWGKRVGLTAPVAAATLTAVYFGAIAAQVPIGWLSDKIARTTVLRLCAAVGLVGALAVMEIGTSLPVLFAVLFLWGGIAAGIYPIALGIAGDRFAEKELVSANAAMIMAYGLGSFIGPALGGVAMDLFDPQGLLAFFALLFALLVAVTPRR